MSTWDEKTVVELRSELRSRGLSTTGRKADLIARLSESNPTEDAAAAAAAAASSSSNNNNDDEDAPIDIGGHTSADDGESTALNTDAPSTASEPPKDSSASLPTPQHDDGGDALNSLAARKRRAERFGTSIALTDDDAKRARLERFGLPTRKEKGLTSTEQKRRRKQRFTGLSEASSGLLDPEKKAARAARFGTTINDDGAVKKSSSPVIAGLTDADSKARRAARFGGAPGGDANKGTLSEEQQKRIHRMGLPVAGLPPAPSTIAL